MGRMTENPAFAVTVVGKVQGVGFRTFAQKAATRLKVTGWVANLRDGSLAVEVVGPAIAVVEFIAALRAGPPGSVVGDLRATPINAARVGLTGFTIRE